MANHVTACVLPAPVSGHSHDIPVVAVGADTAQETSEIPIILSIHQKADRAVLLSTELTALDEIPVSDAWTMAVDQHGRRVRVVLLLDPIPADIPAKCKAFAEKLGADVPPWTGMLLATPQG